jgi:hypothetical protein
MAKVPVVAYMLVTSQAAAMDGADVYVFHHEADNDLRGIAEAYECGELSPKQARRRLLKYQDVIFVPDIDSNGDFWFPFRSDDYGFRPATAAFEREAAALAIPGVSYVHGTDFYRNHFQSLEVRDVDALIELQRRLRGRYKLIGGSW